MKVRHNFYKTNVVVSKGDKEQVISFDGRVSKERAARLALKETGAIGTMVSMVSYECNTYEMDVETFLAHAEEVKEEVKEEAKEEVKEEAKEEVKEETENE